MNNQKINIKDLLAIAGEEEVKDGERAINTCRLYSGGRVNIAGGGAIKNGDKLVAKIANTTLILYRGAKGDKTRSVNAKADTHDLLLNLPANLAKRDAYKGAVEDSKVDGSKCYRDYTIVTTEADGVDYYIVDLAEHKK